MTNTCTVHVNADARSGIKTKIIFDIEEQGENKVRKGTLYNAYVKLLFLLNDNYVLHADCKCTYVQLLREIYVNIITV